MAGRVRSEWRLEADAAARFVPTLPAPGPTEKDGEIDVPQCHPNRTLPPSIPQDCSHPGSFGQTVWRDQPDRATVTQRRLRSPLLIVADGGIGAFGSSGPGIGQARQVLVFRNEKLLDKTILRGGYQTLPSFSSHQRGRESGLLRYQKGSSQALFKSVGSCREQESSPMFPDMEAAASDQNQRPRPYQPPPPSKTTMRTMMRIAVKSMDFSPVGALAANAAQVEQSISHDWHSTERYGAVRSPALTWISDEALDASRRPVQTDAGHRGTRGNAAPCDESPHLETPHSSENSA